MSTCSVGIFWNQTETSTRGPWNGRTDYNPDLIVAVPTFLLCSIVNSRVFPKKVLSSLPPSSEAAQKRRDQKGLESSTSPLQAFFLSALPAL